uniref:Uncharacterized protein n=1 Tax=Aureoumbra lagunensis TaxID=44058 RepID=A0A7S3K3J0_9STRA
METKSENEKPERWWEETTFDYAQNNNDEEYLTTGSEWLGRKIYLQEHEVWATVIKWLPAEKNDGIAFWRVRHADGDDEDLELHELEAAWSCAKIEERNENHTSSSMDDDDDDDNEDTTEGEEEDTDAANITTTTNTSTTTTSSTSTTSGSYDNTP